MDNRDFRNLLVWQRARDLAIDVCRVTAAGNFHKDWAFRDQMRRAAISVPSNIAEGNERGSDRDRARFLYFAKGSLAELSTQSEIAAAIGLLQPDKSEDWLRQCREISRMLAGLLRSRCSG